MLNDLDSGSAWSEPTELGAGTDPVRTDADMHDDGNPDVTGWARMRARSSLTTALSRWWTRPGRLSRSGYRRPWIVVVAMFMAGIAATSALSLWNYYDLSMPIPDPVSAISQMPVQTGTSVNPPSGQTLWTYRAAAPLETSASSDGTTVFLVEGRTPQSGRAVALHVSDGSVVWTRSLNDVADHPPIVAGDLLFIGTRSGRLFALDRHTGESVWEFELESSMIGAPIIRGGVLYAASSGLYALDSMTGEKLWHHDVGGTVTRGLVISDGVLAAIGSFGEINLINASNGTRRLTFPLWFATSAPPIVTGQTLVVVGDGTRVQALDTRQRDVPMEKALRFWWTKLWLWDMASAPPLPRGYLWQYRGAPSVTSFAVGADEERVYLGTSEADGTSRVIALAVDDGVMEWQRSFSSYVLSPAFVTDQCLVVSEKAGKIVCIEKSTGDMQWELETDADLSTAPTWLSSGVVLAPTADGRLIAMR